MREFKKEFIPKPNLDFPEIDYEKISVSLEIGCGVGMHPIQFAKLNPTHQLIAIEKTSEKFQKFQGRLDHHQDIKNIFPIHANGINIVTHYIPKNSLETIFILYPNPYPKKSDQSKRFHAMPFFSFLVERLKPQGKIVMATNEKFLIDEATQFLKEVWKLDFQLEKIDPKTHRPRTHFEKKYLLRNEVCYNLEIFRG